MSLSLRQKLTIIILLIYWPVIFIFAHIPIPQLVYKARVSDKSLHFLAYLVLVFLLWFAISPGRKVKWRRPAVWWVLLVTVWYGVLDEWLQVYVGRNADVLDFFTDLVGTLTGLILLSIFSFWPAFLVVAGIVIFLLTNLVGANIANLLPVTNTVFHLFAYALFTMLWLKYMNLFLPIRTPQPKWLITALAVPIAFLFAVRLFSIICGKGFEIGDVILSALGVVVVVFANYTISLFHQGFAQKLPPGEA